MTATSPRHVLIVDDDPSIRGVFAHIVAAEGYVPVLAANGVEACAALSTHRTPFALVLLDVEMPGIDGFGVRAFQLTTPGLASVPTIMVTGRALDDADRARLSATAYLAKPVPMDQMTRAISKHARTAVEPVLESASNLRLILNPSTI